MRSIEMRQRRAALIEQAGAILTRSHEEKRGLTAEEQQRFDGLHGEADLLLKDIERVERQESAEKEIAELDLAQREKTGERSGPSNDPKENAQLEQDTFRHWLRFGFEGMDERQASVARRRIDRKVPDELQKRAQTVTTTGGGYLIPQGFQNELDKRMVAFGGMREACRILRTSTGNTLDWPTVDDTSNAGRLLSINTQVTTTDVSFGQVQFGAFKYSSDAVLLPSELMQDSGVDTEEIVADLLSERLGRITNTHLTTGDGSSKPRGIVTAATDSTVQPDISSGLTYANMVDIEHAVNPAYRRNPGVGWMVHDNTLALIKKVLDSNGRPIFRTAEAVPGQVDRVLGYPIFINQDIATPGTATNKAFIFGDLRKYIIRVVRPMILWRLEERYRDYDQTGFFAFERLDGDTTRAQAIVYAAMQA